MPVDPEKNKKATANTLLIAIMAGQVGCLTLVIILAAVLGGRALDANLGTAPWFTIGLVLASIPVSLVLMVLVARKTVSKIKTEQSLKSHEEDEIGKNS